MQFIIDNAILIAVAFISGAMLIWPMVRDRAGGAVVSTLQATQLINSKNAQVVDVRPAEDFAKGSVLNAKNLPATALKDRATELKKDRPVILVGDANRGAGAAAAQLRASGFEQVFVLSGGLAAWRDAGLPLKK